MAKATAVELRALTAFFRSAAPQLGFYDRAKRGLRDGAKTESVFEKNLELLRELVRKGVDLKRFETFCNYCNKEKRQVLWVSEVMPPSEIESDSLERNLLRPDDTPVHRLLTRVTVPVTVFGRHEPPEDIKVERAEEYTMRELLLHFYRTFTVESSPERDKSFVGAFSYLLAIYSLDAILLAIDYADDADAVIRIPLDLQDKYLPESEDELNQRKARR
jgi:hypothetical protein